MKICTLLCTTILFACSATSAGTKPVGKSKITVVPTVAPAIVANQIDPSVATVDEDDMTPDVTSSKTFDYKCELNGSLTIYTNTDDDAHAAIRWKSHLYRLKRIETTTGADRFENKKVGLVWIGIPTKGMLMDSRHGEQLANECITKDHYQ